MYMKPNCGKQNRGKVAVYIPADELETRYFIFYDNIHYWSNQNICNSFYMAFRMYIE